MSNQSGYQAPPLSNGLGIAGFIVSLVGILTAGILCPIGLLISFFALFKRPRGFAVAGFIIGLIGTAFIATVLFILLWAGSAAVKFAKPLVATQKTMDAAKGDINAYMAMRGTTPDDATGQGLVSMRLDGWGHALHYRRSSTWSYELRSAGPDGIYNTGDDDVNNYP